MESGLVSIKMSSRICISIFENSEIFLEKIKIKMENDFT